VAIGLLVRGAVEATAVEQARKQAKAARKGVEGAKAAGGRDARRAGLLALVREVERAREARFGELLGEWRSGGAREALRDGVVALAHAAQNVAHQGLEIERKYLLTGLPAVRPDGEVLEVEQGWLPGERLQERVRRVRRGEETRCWRTLKTGRGVTRVEVEEEAPAALFEALWPLTEGLRVFKRRHVIPDAGHVWELDEFTDRELVLAEVELTSADEPVTPPPWLAPYVVRDVTDEDAYVNRNLAR
jgi:CYTH domain-containing protein